jgi:nitrogen regulatory protein P-II 1
VEVPMKKIEAIIAPFKLDEVKEALAKAGIQSMAFSEVKDWDRHGGPVAFYRGAAYIVEFRPKVKVEIMVEDEEVKEVTDAIIGALRTGHLGDGQIAILSVEEVIRVRTGVHGADTMNQRHGLSQGASKIYRPYNESDSLHIS